MDAKKELPAIPTAVSGDGGKLLAVPLHREPGANGDGCLEADTGAGRRGVFKSGGSALWGSSLLFPRDFGHCP
jgi:hypothetical protein